VTISVILFIISVKLSLLLNHFSVKAKVKLALI